MKNDPIPPLADGHSFSGTPTPVRSSARAAWQAERARMEADGRRFTRAGALRSSTIPTRLVGMVEHAVALVGLRRKAIANIRDIRLTEIELFFPHLPPAFDGYSILHLTDLHVGRVPGLLARTAERIHDQPVDLAVMTGDYQTWGTPDAETASAHIAPLVNAINSRDGILAVLGNHDSHMMVEPMESLGIRVLTNEHATIGREDERLLVSGIDDVNYFYTPDAERSLRARPPVPFAIALVHSPEMADIAAQSGYGLYLSGHTHGGQICLPNRKPLLTALDTHKDLASGIWQFDQMIGYTSRGVGVGHRARFNCPPEIVLIRLRREYQS